MDKNKECKIVCDEKVIAVVKCGEDGFNLQATEDGKKMCKDMDCKKMCG